jgi:hypothetical protein
MQCVPVTLPFMTISIPKYDGISVCCVVGGGGGGGGGGKLFFFFFFYTFFCGVYS